MLRNIQKTIVSKTFLISLLLIVLMFTSIGANMEDAYAADLNEASEIGLDADIEDMTVNSQENEILANNQENELLGTNHYSLEGGTFSDVQNIINEASSGDTIYLGGRFSSTSPSDEIKISKRLTITSPSQATFDGMNSSMIFRITSGGAQSSFSNLKFVNGYSSNRGAAALVSAKYVTFENCVFEDNFAENTSGAIHTPYHADTALGLTIKNCNFTNNGAGIAAGAVGAFSHDFKITNCVFDSNYVRGPKALCGGAVQIGLDTEPSYGVVRDCIFKNNIVVTSDASGHAGAGCVRNGSSYYNCTFINNTADHGGALTFHASGNLDNCTLINNTANVFGGGVSILMDYQDFMNLNITDSVFKGNQAPLGGAAKLDGFNIRFERSTFDDNFASEYGGAVNIEAENVEIINCEFNRNIANIDGGAVFIKGNETTVKNSKFTANEAIPDANKLNDGLGGAIYVNSTRVLAQDNVFSYNTARNGSAIYFDEDGLEFRLLNNTLYRNQAWVYRLPISAHDIYYGDVENIKSVIYGGNNIADYDNLAVSNAIYNAADYSKIEIDGEHPVRGATMSGELYQDDREYNMPILMTVRHEDGTVVYNRTLNSSYLGEVSDNLVELKPGKYYVTAKHFEDNYYKGITNSTVFSVYPKIDNRLTKNSNKDTINYHDYAVWTLNITNNGPNNATGVTVRDVLPDGLVWIDDDSNNKYNPSTGVLDIGPLSIGQSFTINIITLVNKTGAIVNRANVTGIEFDINPDNNFDEKSIDVPPAADLAVEKSVNDTNPNYHDLVEWTITVKNNGPDAAHDVNVADLLPQSLIFESCDSQDYDENAGIWNIGTLGVGKSVRLSIITRVNSTGMINNSASVTLREFDYDLSNNHDDAQVNVDAAVDVSVKKSVNDTNPNYLDLVKWTITVKNNGPDIAHNVNVSDILPKSLKLITSSSSNYKNSTGIWSIGTLGVNKSVKLTLVCQAISTGKIVNVANVTSKEFDYDLSNNRHQKSINVNPACDLEVEKIVNDSNPNYRDMVRWTIIVKNNGPDNAHNVTVEDMLPESLVWVSDDSQGKYDHNAGIWDIGDLSNGKTVRLNIISRANATGNFTNIASVNASEFDHNPGNNNDSEDVHVNESGDLAIVKSVNNTKPNYLDLVEWTLVASNNGPDKVTSVVVEDVLPKGLELLNYTASKGFYDDGVWNVCCLERDEIQTLKIVCRVKKTGTLTNVARISGAEYDPDLTNNVDNESIRVPKAADIAVLKEVSDKNTFFGDVVTWMITVKNLGPDKATDVRVFDQLPGELIFKEYSSTRGSYENGVWSLDYLNKGGIECLNITCYVNGLGVIQNNVSARANEYDIDDTNNHDEEWISTAPVSDLCVEKYANVSSANYGDLIKWRVIASNNGHNDATGVFVEDALPDGLELINATCAGYYEDGIWHIGDLNVGDYEVLEIIARVTKTGNIRNVAVISGNEEDPDSSNNEAEYSVDVLPAADLSITKSVSKYVYNVGDLVTYSIRLNNNGPDEAVNVKVSDVFDESLVLKSFEATEGSFDSSSNEWSMDELVAGGEEILLMRFEAVKKGVFRNIVNVISDTFDMDLSNNDGFALVRIVENPRDSPDNFTKNSTAKLDNQMKSKAKSSNYPSQNLEKKTTANLIMLLVASALVSIIFGGSDIIKKR